jgi:hypothetical protein
LITITFFVRCTVYEVEALDCSSRHEDSSAPQTWLFE